MTFLNKLLSWSAPAASTDRETQTVRKIVDELSHLELNQAKYLAAFAYALTRVAKADLSVTDDEVESMRQIIHEQGHLSEAQAVLVVEIARAQNQLFGGTENYQVVQELKALATPGQVREIVDCLFAVAASDAEISTIEEAEIRQISSQLGMEHRDFVAIRALYAGARSVLKGM